MSQLLVLLYQAIEVYKWILIARILLTWLPSINWYDQPFKLLVNLTDPLMLPFRKLIPPIGMIDISPMALFLALGLLQALLAGVINSQAGAGAGSPF
jgi:YggT family protein